MLCDLLIYGTTVEIHAKHNALFQDELTAFVEREYRDFDPDRRIWVVGLERFGTVERLCKRYYSSVEVRYCYDVPGDKTEVDCEQCHYKRKVMNEAFEQQYQSKQHSPQNANLRDQGTTALDQAYRCLELAPGASFEVVEAAYRVLARKHHPDVGGSEVRMKEINNAYSLVKEKGKK